MEPLGCSLSPAALCQVPSGAGSLLAAPEPLQPQSLVRQGREFGDNPGSRLGSDPRTQSLARRDGAPRGKQPPGGVFVAGQRAFCRREYPELGGGSVHTARNPIQKLGVGRVRRGKSSRKAGLGFRGVGEPPQPCQVARKRTPAPKLAACQHRMNYPQKPLAARAKQGNYSAGRGHGGSRDMEISSRSDSNGTAGGAGHKSVWQLLGWAPGGCGELPAPPTLGVWTGRPPWQTHFGFGVTNTAFWGRKRRFLLLEHFRAQAAASSETRAGCWPPDAEREAAGEAIVANQRQGLPAPLFSSYPSFSSSLTNARPQPNASPLAAAAALAGFSLAFSNQPFPSCSSRDLQPP